MFLELGIRSSCFAHCLWASGRAGGACHEVVCFFAFGPMGGESVFRWIGVSVDRCFGGSVNPMQRVKSQGEGGTADFTETKITKTQAKSFDHGLAATKPATKQMPNKAVR